MIIVMLWYTV